MKKTLIALAVLGAFGVAHASDVTIYGKLQPSYDFIDQGGSNGDVVDMKSNSSRLGFKGSEDLGGGLKAIFQIESKAEITETGNGSTLSSRDSWVGLAGEFGSLTFGTHQTAYVKSTASYDFFSDSIGDYNNIMAKVNGSKVLDDRADKSAYYKSPKMSGFQVLASYAMNDAHEYNTADNDNYALALTYANGPLKLVAAYEVDQNANSDYTGMKIGAGYKLPMGTQLNAIYENVDIDGSGNGDQNNFYIAASHPITSTVDIMGTYMMADDYNNVNNSGAKAYNLGAKYKFSKRTNVLAVYSAVDNDSAASYGMNSGYSAAAAGEKVSGFSVRLQHNF